MKLFDPNKAARQQARAMQSIGKAHAREYGRYQREIEKTNREEAKAKNRAERDEKREQRRIERENRQQVRRQEAEQKRMRREEKKEERMFRKEEDKRALLEKQQSLRDLIQETSEHTLYAQDILADLIDADFDTSSLSYLQND